MGGGGVRRGEKVEEGLTQKHSQACVNIQILDVALIGRHTKGSYVTPPQKQIRNYVKTLFV